MYFHAYLDKQGKPFVSLEYSREPYRHVVDFRVGNTVIYSEVLTWEHDNPPLDIEITEWLQQAAKSSRECIWWNVK